MALQGTLEDFKHYTKQIEKRLFPDGLPDDDSSMAGLLNTLSAKDVGGIDMNEIKLKSNSEFSAIRFSPEALQPFMNIQFEGLSPIIIKIVPIPNLYPLLGLKPREEEELAA